MRKVLFLFVLIFFTSRVAFATAQMPDYLALDGAEVPIHSNPLERYLAQHPERRPESKISSTALWRGYVAWFEVSDGRLRVKAVKVLDSMPPDTGEDRYVDVTHKVFPAGTDRTLTWFTGFLILPQGKVTSYVHMGYASRYERYRLLFVREGKIAADRLFSAEEYADYKKLQFAAYTRTEKYRQMKQQLGDRADRAIDADGFLQIFDVDFAVDMLIDYKDFRPSSTGSVAK